MNIVKGWFYHGGQLFFAKRGRIYRPVFQEARRNRSGRLDVSTRVRLVPVSMKAAAEKAS